MLDSKIRIVPDEVDAPVHVSSVNRFQEPVPGEQQVRIYLHDAILEIPSVCLQRRKKIKPDVVSEHAETVTLAGYIIGLKTVEGTAFFQEILNVPA